MGYVSFLEGIPFLEIPSFSRVLSDDLMICEFNDDIPSWERIHIPLKSHFLKMIFLFQLWDTLVFLEGIPFWGETNHFCRVLSLNKNWGALKA